jgi:hypothetical protein
VGQHPAPKGHTLVTSNFGRCHHVYHHVYTGARPSATIWPQTSGLLSPGVRSVGHMEHDERIEPTNHTAHHLGTHLCLRSNQLPHSMSQGVDRVGVLFPFRNRLHEGYLQPSKVQCCFSASWVALLLPVGTKARLDGEHAPALTPSTCKHRAICPYVAFTLAVYIACVSI